MYPAGPPPSRRGIVPAPDYRNVDWRTSDDVTPFSFLPPGGNASPRPMDPSRIDPTEMPQALTHPTTYARPAADLAVPGMRPSCAVKPRAHRFDVASAIGGSRGWNAGRTGGLHPIGGTGKDGRYGRDQRGRAVAYA